MKRKAGEEPVQNSPPAPHAPPTPTAVPVPHGQPAAKRSRRGLRAVVQTVLTRFFGRLPQPMRS